jgi:hypothetical protein
MSEEEITIKPNKDVVLCLSEAYQNHFIDLTNQEEELQVLCRVVIQDQNGFGITLPAKLVDNKEVAFTLPEQLCIFNPNKSYILKVEVVLETELITPIFQSCQIDLNDLLVAEEEKDEAEDEEELTSPNEPYSEPEEDSDLDTVLDAIAPLPRVEVKKTKVEDLVNQLDEEFVKNALWRKEQMAPVPVNEPEPSTLNLESLAVKQKMKALLRNMLT